MSKRLTTIVSLLLLIFASFVAAAVAEDAKVTLIEVQGNRRIETATILSKIKTREGDVFSPARIKEDITTLYQLGHFEDIQVKTEGFESGLKVIFSVREKPLIREVRYEGNDELSLEKLKEVVTLLPRTAYNVQLVQDNAEKIRLKYQDDGFYATTVVPVITELRSGDRNVTFYIDEGPKIRLTEIVITGAKAFSDDEIKKQLKTQEHWFFSFLGRSGTLRTEELRADVETIKDLYYNKGYIQVQVDEPVIEKMSDEELRVKINIREGDQFTIGGIVVKGNAVLSTDDILKEIKLKRGDVFSKDLLRQDITRIMDRYDGIARPFASVIPLFDIKPDTKNVIITIEIQEGGEVRIGRINISGNFKTRDKVIRREFRLDEGDLYSKQALKRTYERLNNLNFFETVEVSPERRLQEPIMDLNVKVKEKMTGTFSIGGGYSSVDRVMALAEVSQGNLFGRGQLLKFKTQWGKTTKTISASFMEPYLFDKPIWGKIDIYKQKYEYDGYNLHTDGFGLGVGKSFSEYTSGSVKYSWDKSTITDVDETKITSGSALDFQRKHYGDIFRTSSLSLTLARDSRDYYLDPKSGSRNSYFIQYTGGVLEGDPHFVKQLLDSAWYFPVIGDSSFMVRGRIGYIGNFDDTNKPIPLGERFYVGGSGSVRGFKWGTDGPVEYVASSASYNRIGGDKELIFNFEYNFPIVSAARLKGVLFYDIGRAFNGGMGTNEHIHLGDLRQSVGWGIRWFSPIGPLRFEWGYIINQQPTDQQSTFEFSIGSVF